MNILCDLNIQELLAGGCGHQCDGQQHVASKQPAFCGRPRTTESPVALASCAGSGICAEPGQPVEGDLEARQCGLQVLPTLLCMNLRLRKTSSKPCVCYLGDFKSCSLEWNEQLRSGMQVFQN